MDIRPTSNTIAASTTQQTASERTVASTRVAAAAPAAAPIRIDASKPAGAASGKEELAQALKSINSALQDRSPGLEFTIDRDSDRSVVKVVDKATQEVIRQMPSREAIDIARALDKLQSVMFKASA
jgi:flagellar protein FlaG